MVKKKPNHNEILERLHQSLHSLVNKHKTLDRLYRKFGNEILIGTDIHAIAAVGDDSMSNVSLLAKKMGVTKAAASQTVRKLQKNGYLRKLRDENNKREILLALTEKGISAYKGHREDWNMSCMKFFPEVTTEQIENFILIADKISGTADDRIGENS
ncbi:MarR family winged helix-turn-helix transcriptional regulator [Thermodesulfobacteriota bacterium]